MGVYNVCKLRNERTEKGIFYNMVQNNLPNLFRLKKGYYC